MRPWTKQRYIHPQVEAIHFIKEALALCQTEDPLKDHENEVGREVNMNAMEEVGREAEAAEGVEAADETATAGRGALQGVASIVIEEEVVGIILFVSTVHIWTE